MAPSSRKRKRSLSTAEDTMDDSSKKPKGAQYLADAYPSTRPIKVQLTAIRAGQARIFTTKLRAAGATVLDSNDSSPASVVITDTPPCSQEEKPPTYVTPKWAQDVLRRRRAVSPTKYALIPIEPKPEPPSPDSTSAKLVVPGPWAIVTGAAASNDVRLRWLEALPKYAVERATYEQSVFESPNAELVVALREVARVRELLAGDGKGGSQDGAVRGLAYKNAAAAIASLPFAIRTGEAAKIRDVGLGVADVARQFLVTGSLAEANLLRTDTRVKALDELTSVYGVGVRTAQRLYDAGVRSMEQLHDLARRHANFSEILKGVHLPEQPYDALTLQQARAFRDAVATAWKEAGLRYRVVLCGGYRRLKSRGHDVDLLFCREDDDENTSPIIPKAMQVVADKGWLRDTLHEENGHGRRFGPESTTHATPVRSTSHEVQLAVCEFNGQIFRADFVGVRDATSFAFATLAWSGSVMFQRSLRRYAVKRKGLVFSKHGLFDADNGQRAKIAEKVRTEHDVFHVLGLQYRAPFERAA